MSSGWLTFATVGVILFGAMAIVVAAVLKAAWAQKEREALTSSDLRALEESAVTLIEQLRAEADHRAMDLDARCECLGKLIEQADARISALQSALASSQDSRRAPEAKHARVSRQQLDPRSQKVVDMASAGIGVAEIAKQAGLGCAEVKLMLRLAGVGNN